MIARVRSSYYVKGPDCLGLHASAWLAVSNPWGFHGLGSVKTGWHNGALLALPALRSVP